MYQPNLKSVALPIPEIIAIEVLGDANPNLGEDDVAWSAVVYVVLHHTITITTYLLTDDELNILCVP